MTAALGDHAHAEGKLDASYTISFARIGVGDITATVVFGDSDYAISARGRAGGVMKALVDGEGSFAAKGTVKDGHPVSTTFTSKIVSNETSEVTMVLDEGRVKELTAIPPPNRDSVPVMETNRQGIVDPLTVVFGRCDWRGFVPSGVSADAADLRWPPTLRSQARIQAHGQGDSRKRIFGAACGVFGNLRTNRRPSRVNRACQISFRRARNGNGARTGRRHAPAGTVPDVGR
jgi:hypothetical protein